MADRMIIHVAPVGTPVPIGFFPDEWTLLEGVVPGSVVFEGDQVEDFGQALLGEAFLPSDRVLSMSWSFPTGSVDPSFYRLLFNVQHPRITKLHNDYRRKTRRRNRRRK